MERVLQSGVNFNLTFQSCPISPKCTGVTLNPSHWTQGFKINIFLKIVVHKITFWYWIFTIITVCSLLWQFLCIEHILYAYWKLVLTPSDHNTNTFYKTCSKRFLVLISLRGYLVEDLDLRMALWVRNWHMIKAWQNRLLQKYKVGPVYGN